MHLRSTSLLAAGLSLVLSAVACNGTVEEIGEDESTMHGDALTGTITAGVKLVTTANVRLRAAASTNAATLTVIPKGTEVIAKDAAPQNGFYRVTFAGQEGFCHGNYLARGAGAAPVEVPAEPASSSSSGRWMPKPGLKWQWQLTGTIDTSLDVKAYDIDLFTTPKSTIDGLHAAGKKVICYFSAGSYEPNRPDSSRFPAAAKGKVMDGWPDERWLDVRSQAVAEIMKARMDVAKQKGCDAVEPDNVDGYSNDTGYPLTAANQLAFNKMLAAEAHARGLSIALKNDLDQIPELVSHFDFALNEECFKYSECSSLGAFVRAGKAVLQVEYGGSSLASSVCSKANAQNFDTLVKRLDLDAWRIACR